MAQSIRYGKGTYGTGLAVVPCGDPAGSVAETVVPREMIRMNDTEVLMGNDRFAKDNGIRLEKVADGYAKATMEVTPRHLNGVGIVQGGAIFTLADLAFAAAANSHENVAVAINVNISFLKASTCGTLTAEANEQFVNAKLGSCSVNVTDESGDLIAVFQGMVYRKRDRVADLAAKVRQAQE